MSRSVSPVDVGKSDVVSGAGVQEEAAEIGSVNKNSKPDLSSSKSNSPNNPYKSSSRLLPLRCHVSSDTGGVSGICLISELNTYQNRWTIKARVTTKSDIRSWVNAKGEGSLFSVELIDSSAIDIKATFFKEAVDKFYEMLEVDKVYTFSGGRLKDAKMEYNACKCPYEISFDQKAEIHLADDTGDIQSHMFNFTKISDLEGVEEGKLVDILVVVKSVGDPASVVLKKIGKERLKCDLTVVDDSGVEINLTVWGDRAREAPIKYGNDQPVVAFRHVRVSNYGGKSLSTTSGGMAVVAPSMAETGELQAWWQKGREAKARSLSIISAVGEKLDSFSSRKDIKCIKIDKMGMGDKPDWLLFKGTLTSLEKDKEGGAWYTACVNADEPCKNRSKVNQMPDMNWLCNKCQEIYPKCVRQWIFSGEVVDDTSSVSVLFYNKEAEMLFGGVTADQVYAETYGNDTGVNQDLYNSYFAKANNTDWIFKCKVMKRTITVHSMQAVNYAQESRDLLDIIATF